MFETVADGAKPQVKVILIGANVRPQYEKHAADQASIAGDRQKVKNSEPRIPAQPQCFYHWTMKMTKTLRPFR
jgi:hypothetical protein